MFKFSKKLIVCLLIFYCASAVWAQTKPVKKIPARAGNFEITAGTTLPAPINMEKFLSSAQKAAVKLGWKIIHVEPGVISLKLEKRDWWLEMNICYWADEYWYEYQDSWNLDADLKNNKIHRNYARWIANLEKEISGFYF